MLLCSFLFCASISLAQDDSESRFSFGFQLGVSAMRYSMKLDDAAMEAAYPGQRFPYHEFCDYHHYHLYIWDEYGTPPPFLETDIDHFRIEEVNCQWKPGFSVGVFGKMRVGEQLALEVVPSFRFGEQQIRYEVALYDGEGRPLCNESGKDVSRQIVVSDDKNYNFIEMPVLLIYNPKWSNEIYLVGGVNPQLYIANVRSSKYNPYSSGLDPIFMPEKKVDLAAEFGLGFHLLKKVSAEIKMSCGLLELLPKSNESFYYIPFESVKSRRIQFSLVF